MRTIVVRILGGIVALIAVPVVGLTLLLGNEGYPTLAASRNYVFQDGQIRVELPSDCRITEMNFDTFNLESISVDGNTGVARVGYTTGILEFSYEHDGKTKKVTMGEVRKLNDWNRIRFRGSFGPDGDLQFSIDENGVSREPKRYSIKHGH
ncbi:hypothetical protein AAFN60_04035 [Roseibacillus persicicus]|uniref:hypothetical protein n=1 Tax=Roseibacillus persicicus TaxID=454148 RepID=UPI00398B5178